MNIALNKIFPSILIAALFTITLSPQTSRAAILKKINPGDSIYNLLSRNGFSSKQRNIAMRSPSLHTITLAPGELYSVAKNQDKSVNIKFYPRNQNPLVIQKKGSTVKVRHEKGGFLIKNKTVKGKVIGSLLGSFQKATKDKTIAYRVLDAFVFDHKLRKQVQRGAPFELTFEQLYDGKHFVRTGELLSAKIKVKNKWVHRSYVKNKKASPYAGAFVDRSWSQSSRPFYAPALRSQFSSLFMPRRKHPVTGRVQPHHGIDYELPKGSRILAAASGKILRLGYHRAAGNRVVIKHANGYESYYNHLKSIDPKLKAGQQVKVGQTLGLNGCTGYCTKPHLHFALKRGKKWVDPAKLVRSYSYDMRRSVK